MTPALFVLGTGTLVCALTAGAHALGRPGSTAVPPTAPDFPDIAPEDRARLLAMVPAGHSVLVRAARDPVCRAYANAVLDLLASEGRGVESLVVEDAKDAAGTGLVHRAEQRRHEILVLPMPWPDGAHGSRPGRPPGNAPPDMGNP